MAVALNKTSLKEQRNRLETYERFLPSLDLKRQQLLADYQKARAAAAQSQRELDEAIASQTGLMKLLGASGQDMTGLVAVTSVSLGEENVVGARLPVVKDIEFRVADYSMMTKPFWVDFLIEALKKACRLTIRLNVDRRRLRLLDQAVQKITQRVNLFEKVLIPEAKENIQRIRIYLADAERAAVVRSKIAKTKQRAQETREEH